MIPISNSPLASMIGLTIDNAYQITQLISSKSHIFKGLNLKTQQPVAIKFEPCSSNPPTLLEEACFYKAVSKIPDAKVPKVHYQGKFNESNVLVTDFLGPNLEQLLIQCKGKFSLKTVLMLGIEMLSVIKDVHSCAILHKDIKPANFTLGRGKHQKEVYITNFELAKYYLRKKLNVVTHIRFAEAGETPGDLIYASINSHMGIPLTRRDDLESFCYSLIKTLKGSLPWENLETSKSESIMEKKLSTSIDELCEGLPKEFVSMLVYARMMLFAVKPDYEYLEGLMRGLLERSGYEDDKRFDWDVEEKGKQGDKEGEKENEVGKEVEKDRKREKRERKKEKKRAKREEKLKSELEQPKISFGNVVVEDEDAYLDRMIAENQRKGEYQGYQKDVLKFCVLVGLLIIVLSQSSVQFVC